MGSRPGQAAEKLECEELVLVEDDALQRRQVGALAQLFAIDAFQHLERLVIGDQQLGDGLRVLQRLGVEQGLEPVDALMDRLQGDQQGVGVNLRDR